MSTPFGPGPRMVQICGLAAEAATTAIKTMANLDLINIFFVVLVGDEQVMLQKLKSPFSVFAYVTLDKFVGLAILKFLTT